MWLQYMSYMKCAHMCWLCKIGILFSLIALLSSLLTHSVLNLRASGKLFIYPYLSDALPVTSAVLSSMRQHHTASVSCSIFNTSKARAAWPQIIWWCWCSEPDPHFYLVLCSYQFFLSSISEDILAGSTVLSRFLSSHFLSLYPH